MIDMEISSDTCTNNIGQLANDAKNTFDALNSVFNLSNVTRMDSLSMDISRHVSFLIEKSNKLSEMNLRSPLSTSAKSHHSESFFIPLTLDDTSFSQLLSTIKTSGVI